MAFWFLPFWDFNGKGLESIVTQAIRSLNRFRNLFMSDGTAGNLKHPVPLLGIEIEHCLDVGVIGNLGNKGAEHRAKTAIPFLLLL